MIGIAAAAEAMSLVPGPPLARGNIPADAPLEVESAEVCEVVAHA